MLAVLKLISFVSFVYFVSTLLGYLIHKLFHKEWMGFAAKSHLVHHNIKYPPGDLISDKYRHAGKNTTILLFIPIVIGALSFTVFLGYVGILTPFYAALGAIEILLITYLHNALHDAFHVHNSFWNRIPGFKKMQGLHFEHHLKMDTNFGIFDFTWDKIFKTYSAENNDR